MAGVRKKTTSKKRNGKVVKDEKPKKQERTFKNRVVDPTLMKWVRVDHKTLIQVDKNKNDAEVVARYHANQEKALKQLKK